MKKDMESLELARECVAESKKLFYENRIEEAEKVAIKARDIALDIGEYQVYALAMNLLLVMYESMSDESAEIDAYLKGTEIAAKHNLHNELAILNINIGARFKSLGDSATASKYFEIANKERKLRDVNAETAEGTQFELVMAMNLGELYVDSGEMDKAAEQLEIARKEVEKFDDERVIFEFKSFEYHLMWEFGQHDEVREKIDSLVEMAKKSAYMADYVECIEDVCKLLKRMKEYDKWESVLKAVDKFASDDNATLHIIAHEMWMDYYETIGDIENYEKNCIDYAKHMIRKKSKDNKEKAVSMKFKLDSYENEKKRKKESKNFYIDTLTKVGNRNKLLEDSKVFVEESYKNKTSITIGLLDIDYFKDCNDTYGHIRGDECLKSVASVISNTVGKNGNVYRFGGDEFLVLMSKMSDVKKVNGMAQMIQDRVEALNIANEMSPVKDHITISQGYTMGIAEKDDNINALINLADKVLYKAKRYGRNNHKFMKISEILSDGVEE
ncbi:MAG: GGDEF domain-containing protein [Lachnospiraceae bacterium]|nr:GGDEF domain-containing protein [Lachnospiraceae bacterium]